MVRCCWFGLVLRVHACACVYAVVCANNTVHPWQINFLQRHKRPSLDVLLKHMPEVEAMRFLHDVVDVCHLESKLNQKFPGEKVMEEVCVCLCVRCACDCVGVRVWR